MTPWTLDDLPDQTGRTAVVTGANTGIGWETARALARRGARTILACRDEEKGREAARRILAGSPAAHVEFQHLDLADLESVAACAERLLSRLESLDLLIGNAGVMIPPESRTAQGFELQFGVNHLGHFALTGRLLPLLLKTPHARVVVVSSTAARRARLDFDDLDFQKRGYDAWRAYGTSKLANQLFVRELQRRLDEAGSKLLVTAAHPGWTATDLQRHSVLMQMLNALFAMHPAQGALPTLRAAVDPEADGAAYYGPDGFLQMRGHPVRIPMLPAALDDDDARRLWTVSEELTGVHWSFEP